MKSRKRQYETEYQPNNLDDKRTSQKDPRLEKPRNRWSLRVEEINSIT